MRYLKLTIKIAVLTLVLYIYRPLECFYKALYKAFLAFIDEFEYVWGRVPEDKKLYKAIFKTFKEEKTGG